MASIGFMSAKMATLPSRAYVTLLAGNGDYWKGVVGLAKGLRRVESAYPLVVAVLPDVPIEHRQILKAQGCIVREIVPVYPPENQTRFAMADYVINYSKFRIWEFVEYSKMVYLDGDIQVFRNIDHLFDLPDGKLYAVMDCFCEKTWSQSRQYEIGYCQQCPDKVEWPAEMGSPPPLYFNAGMFVFEPSLSTSDDLLTTLKITPPTSFAEQDFLNMFFKDVYKPISPAYNLVLAMLWRHPENVNLDEAKVVHYCAAGSKPWRYTGKEENMDRDDIKMLVKKWWDIYDDESLDYKGNSAAVAAAAGSGDRIKPILAWNMEFDQEGIDGRPLVDQLNLLTELLKAQIANEARREQEANARESRLHDIIVQQRNIIKKRRRSRKSRLGDVRISGITSKATDDVSDSNTQDNDDRLVRTKVKPTTTGTEPGKGKRPRSRKAKHPWEYRSPKRHENSRDQWQRTTRATASYQAFRRNDAEIQNEQMHYILSQLERRDNVERRLALLLNDNIGMSPLAPHLLERTHSTNFEPPELKAYKHATGDPIAHLMDFKGRLILHKGNEPLLCKLFRGTLRDEALRWFTYELQPGSIQSWGQLCRAFVQRFIYNVPPKKSLESMFLIKQKADEDVTTFLSRFREETTNIIADEATVVRAFKQALNESHNDLFHYLTRTSEIYNLTDLARKVERFRVIQEEENLREKDTSGNWLHPLLN